MERLLFAFVLIGTTLACSPVPPVPEPKVKGKGHDIVYVVLMINQTYKPAGVSQCLSDFSETKIQQYSASLGDFSDLNCTEIEGYFFWTFTLTNANCSIVKAWVNQINSSDFYINGYAECDSTRTRTPPNENLIEIKTPPTTTTTAATPLAIVPSGTLSAAPLVIPYQPNNEEPAEHLEELS